MVLKVVKGTHPVFLLVSVLHRAVSALICIPSTLADLRHIYQEGIGQEFNVESGHSFWRVFFPKEINQILNRCNESSFQSVVPSLVISCTNVYLCLMESFFISWYYLRILALFKFAISSQSLKRYSSCSLIRSYVCSRDRRYSISF